MNRIQPSFLKRAWPVWLLTALAVLFLWDIWFGGRALLLRDFFFNDVTTRHYIGQTLMQGKFPTWYSLSQCGLPFAASPYNSVFYPPNWIYALPSVEWAMLLSWTFHLVLAGGGCYALARYWRLGVAASLFAAVSFTFSTFSTAWIEFGPGLFCIAWGMLSLLLVSRLIDTTAAEVLRHSEAGTALRFWPLFLRNSATIAALALVFTLQVLISGEFFYYVSLLVAAYGVARWAWHGSWKTVGFSMGWIGLAGALAMGLAAPQLFSTFEIMGFSVRSGSIDPMLDMASSHPRHWLTLLLPYLYGRPGYPASYWAPTVFEFANGTFYIGILPLIAALFCGLRPRQAKLDPAARERRFLIWFFAAVTLAGLTMAAGKYTPVYAFMHEWMPGMSHLRFATKFYYYVVFSLSVLGAVGLQSLLSCSDPRGRIRVWWIAAGSFGVFLLGYLACLLSNDFLLRLMAHPKTPSVVQMDSAMFDYTWAVVFTLLGLGLFGLLAFRQGARKWAPGVIVAVAFINLYVISRQAQPTGPAGIYAQEPKELIQKIGNDPMGRYLSNFYRAQQYVYGDSRPEVWEWFIHTGGTSHAQEAGLSSLTPVGLFLNRYMFFFSAISTAAPPIREKVADMMSMRYFIGGAPFDQILWGNASHEITIAERPSSLPRAFVTTRWSVASGEGPVLRAIASDSFDPHKEAIVEPLAGATVPPCDPLLSIGKTIGKVSSFADHGNAVSLEVTTPSRALLVLGDTFYPGWTATVDGVKAPIFQANYLFRGVFLEPGAHRVEFSFTPTHFALGAWIWGVAVAICGGLVWVPRRFAASWPVSQKAARSARK